MCIIVEQSRSLLDGLDIFKHKIQVPFLCFVGIVSSSVIFTYEAKYKRVFKYAHIYVCMLSSSVMSDCDPMDCSPPAFPVHGILQARMLE